MKTLRLAAVFTVSLLSSLSASAADVKVFIDATPDDARLFLEKLNENGKEKNLSFALATTGYMFRIAVDAESATTGDILFGGGADAAAAVMTPECKLLFVVSRGGRTKKAGAMNALSKEIVKKLPAHMNAS